METTGIPTNAGVVAEVTRQAITPVPVDFDDAPIVAIGGQLRNLEMYRQNPLTIMADVRLDDLESLAAYVMDFAGIATRAYIDADECEIVVVLNDDSGTLGADWRRHRAHMPLRKTEDWCRWTSHNRATMGQVEFAEFLEDNAECITEPPAAELLEIVTNFEKVSTMTFKSQVRLEDDRRRFTFREDGAAEDELILPSTLRLTLPIFKGFDDTGYVLRARLRHRLSSGHLSFFYELVRPDLVLEAAFDDIAAKFIAECEPFDTPTPDILHGRAPESR